MTALTTLDDTLYCEILALAVRGNAPDEHRHDRAPWRDEVRALMLQQLRAQVAYFAEDEALEGYVAACEGHNHAIAKSVGQYAAMNVKDLADRLGRKHALTASVDLPAAQVEEEDEPIEVLQPAVAPVTVPQPVVAKRPPSLGLANLVANARWAR